MQAFEEKGPRLAAPGSASDRGTDKGARGGRRQFAAATAELRSGETADRSPQQRADIDAAATAPRRGRRMLSALDMMRNGADGADAADQPALALEPLILGETVEAMRHAVITRRQEAVVRRDVAVIPKWILVVPSDMPTHREIGIV